MTPFFLLLLYKKYQELVFVSNDNLQKFNKLYNINVNKKQTTTKGVVIMASRREKYPETNTFTYYNANPKGKITCDCVLRAVCTALNEPYNDVMKEMFGLNFFVPVKATKKKCLIWLLKLDMNILMQNAWTNICNQKVG